MSFGAAARALKNCAAGGRVLAHSTNLDTAARSIVPSPAHRTGQTARRPRQTLTQAALCFKIERSGPVAQLGARFHGMEEVIGSIPIRSTNPFKHLDFPPSSRDLVASASEKFRSRRSARKPRWASLRLLWFLSGSWSPCNPLVRQGAYAKLACSCLISSFRCFSLVSAAQCGESGGNHL